MIKLILKMNMNNSIMDQKHKIKKIKNKKNKNNKKNNYKNKILKIFMQILKICIKAGISQIFKINKKIKNN